MKKFWILSILVCSGLLSFSQNWVLDLGQAKTLAKEGNKKIILVFQGSDWCAPCMKLEKEIWATEKFKQHAQDNYVLLQADFPRRKANKLSKEQQEKNGQLAEKYNPNGFFPHVVVLDAEGKVLGKTGYKKISVAEYIQQLDSF